MEHDLLLHSKQFEMPDVSLKAARPAHSPAKGNVALFSLWPVWADTHRLDLIFEPEVK